MIGGRWKDEESLLLVFGWVDPFYNLQPKICREHFDGGAFPSTFQEAPHHLNCQHSGGKR